MGSLGSVSFFSASPSSVAAASLASLAFASASAFALAAASASASRSAGILRACLNDCYLKVWIMLILKTWIGLLSNTFEKKAPLSK